jgi:N-acetylated-alpha-linked acidic dipeptidase
MHLKVEMDYQQRPIYDVIAKLHGATDDEWVVLGNHHDAWVYGAADPGSGTTGMLELARSLGELSRSGWKPRRTIVLCEWDAEEPGLIGSTDWVQANRAELQKKAVAYINTDVGVTGPNFSASAVPSLKEFIRDATKQVEDPQTGSNIYSAWRSRVNGGSSDVPTRGPAISSLGAGSDFSSFLDFAGIPSIDLSFTGDYGVYHSLYDDFYWMKHFGDPDFSYHATLARLLGVMTLRLSEADVEPFDYSAYASEIADAGDNLSSRVAASSGANAMLKRFADASVEFSDAASQAQDALAAFSYDPQKEAAINRGLASVEQGLLNPQGLNGRPWFKHTVFAPGSQTGYSAEILPGLTEALDHHDLPAAQRESDALAAALHRAALRLNDVSALARGSAAQSRLGN